MSSVDDKDNLASVSVILNLWAPVAFAFDEPVALSNKDVSSVEVTKFLQLLIQADKLVDCHIFLTQEFV